MIFNNNNIITFIHIPKTAGTSLHNGLYVRFKCPTENKCINYKYIGHWKNEKTGQWSKDLFYHINEDFKGFTNDLTKKNQYFSFKNLNFITFAVVRSPYSRIVSAYNYLKKFKDSEDQTMSIIYDKYFRSLDDMGLEEKDKFKYFIDILVSSKEFIFKNNIVFFKNMSSFISKDGKILVKHTIRFEDLQKDFNLLLKKYGYPELFLPFSKKNKSPFNTDFFLENDAETKEKIYKFYSDDFKDFGY